MRLSLLCLSFMMSSPLVFAAENTSSETDNVFTLGTVEVTEEAYSIPIGETAVSQQEMENFNLNTVSAALATQAGVSLSHNARNEDIIAIRGFDSRRVPVFLDGIPLYVPYDGYVDFSRFTTFDLAKIQVSKGAASLLYGPNTLGGAINLVSRKPQKAFEGDARLGFGSGDKSMVATNLGTNQEQWYGQIGLSYLDVNTFPLGSGFVDYKKKPTDTGDERENAYATDWKASLKVGYTPNANDEYALGYTKQSGEKGNPVYTGLSTQGIRYWQWPYWDKDSVYFLSQTALDAKNVFKSRIYQDRYENQINAYTDATYSKAGQTDSFPSIYNDKTIGASLEWVNSSFNNHQLHVAGHYKEDQHEEMSPSTPMARYKDVTYSLALEDVIALNDSTALRIGTSYEQRDAREVYYWNTGSTDAINGLAELTHALSAETEVFASISHKTRFPTIKDRYSVRLGRAIANPDLKPEVALHGETGIRLKPWIDANASASVFYSRIDDLIQTNVVASTQCGGTTCDQAQNIGEARHQGIELTLDQAIGTQFSFNLSYLFLDMDNLDKPETPLTDAPRQRLFAHASWHPNATWETLITAEAETGRIVPYSGSGQSSFRTLSGYGIWGIKNIWQLTGNTSINAGLDNIGDKSYELADGIPMAGRTWFVNAAIKF